MARWRWRSTTTPTTFSAATRTNPSSLNATAPAITTRVAGPILQLPTSRLARREYKSMNTSQELTIVIPAKNEAELLPRLLESIAQQDSPGIRETTVYVADANSTDGTPDLALSFRDRIDVRVIPGGLPSAGRNAGARVAITPYVLFLDADMELADRTLIRRALELMMRKKLHCVTTNIW